MNIQTLKTQFFFWKYCLIKPDALQQYRQMLHDQYLSADEIEALNWQRTKKLLDYAYKHVPFYQKRFKDMGITPADIVTQNDYSKIPCLTRRDLIEHFDDLISDEATSRMLRVSTTGGSSGVPVKVMHTKKIVRAAAGWRMLNWWNLPPDCDSGSVYRSLGTSFKSRLLEFIQWFPTRHLLLNATSFTEKDIEVFIQKFNRIRPPLLHGYVGAMDTVADYILQNNIKVHAPEVIWCTSAPITPIQQKKIESAFNAPVYDQYGCCEIYWLAAECPKRSGLHMFYDIRRFEFLNEHDIPVPNGEYGDIAITDLQNNLFPLIRYRNGDRGRRLTKNCSCGCNLPLMDKVKGRISESFILPSGARLNGEYLTTLFDHAPDAVRQFRVHQNADYSIEIFVVLNPHKETAKRICENVKLKLIDAVHAEVPVLLYYVSTIEQHGGKLCFITSSIAQKEYQKNCKR